MLIAVQWSQHAPVGRLLDRFVSPYVLETVGKYAALASDPPNCGVCTVDSPVALDS